MYTQTNDYSSNNEHKRSNPNLDKLRRYIDMDNISSELDEEALFALGREVCKNAEEDDMTREEWFDKYNEALKIAKQTIDKKIYPFDGASNVKIPLILQGCIMFNSRLMPEIIQNNKTVNVQIMGNANEDLERSAKRISDHMSLQTMKICENWVSDTDKMMMALPLIGTVFRKWTYDAIERKPVSCVLFPTDVIVNNDCATIENAPRITHLVRLSKNEVIEKQRAGLFSEFNLLNLAEDQHDNENTSEDKDKSLPSNQEDNANYYAFYEQCLWYDLDDDGYCEPYIVTVYKKTQQVVRIMARYDEQSFVYNAKGELIKIKAKNYYTAHHFLPSPDGTFLGLGFGQILLHLNNAINSATNNLIDAATLSNVKGGFISKDLRLQSGNMSFVPGEWKKVNVPTGASIANSIFPLPVSEPSQTLFALLQFLMDVGKQIANINDVLSGNPISANMPATSVVTMVEQGSKIFNSILTRLYDSLRKEYKVLFDINKTYLPLYAQEDLMIKDGFITLEDYTSERYEIFPVANPALGVDATRIAKMQVLMGMANDPMLNKREILQRNFEVLGIPNTEKLFTPPEVLSQPTPEMIMAQANMGLIEAQSAKTHAEAAAVIMGHELKAHELDVRAEELKLKAKELEVKAASSGGQLAINTARAQAEIAKATAVTSPQEINKAEHMIDKELNKTDVEVDTSDIQQEMDRIVLTNQQPSGNVSQNVPQEGGQEQQEQPSEFGAGIPRDIMERLNQSRATPEEAPPAE